jgi:hypothetical protein
MHSFWRFQRFPPTTLVLLGITLFFAVACKKSASTPQAEKIAKESSSRDPIKQKEARLRWNIQTLGEAYDRVGSRNKKWDKDVRQGMAELAKYRADSGGSPQKAGIFFDRAIGHGCDDPLVLYCSLRFGTDLSGADSKSMAGRFETAAIRLNQSAYHPIRKFYGAVRAAEILKSAGVDLKRVYPLRKMAADNCVVAACDASVPFFEIYYVCTELLYDFPELAEFFRVCEGSIDHNWPEEPGIHVLKGKAALTRAWAKRGGAFAANTSEEQFKGFQDELGSAEQALSRAWELDQSNQELPLYMIHLELGQGRGRDRMELWFDRAMKLNSQNYDACYLKLEYLQPKWFGSVSDMLEFGRECVASTNWGGAVPLILSDAHELIIRAYPKPERPQHWKNPEVWKDIKASFEKCFQVNPPGPRGHERYARFAAWCEQWEEFAQQIKLVQSINYDYFGEIGAFEAYVQKAEKALGRSLL